MKVGAEFWTAHVAAIKQEAISASAYAKRHGISLAALYYWQRKLNAAASKSGLQSQAGKFVALRVADAVIASRSTPCTLILASGMRLEMPALPAPEWLAALGRAGRGAR